jgi:hypothetical protein
MKRFALLIVCLVAMATPALAINGVGDVSVYADDQGSNCNISSPGGGGLVHVYVVHKFQPGEQGTYSRFKGEWPAGMTFLGAFNVGSNVAIGTFDNDVAVAYGVCVTSTHLVGDALFTTSGVSPTCSYFNLVASVGQTTPLATDCTFAEFEVATGQGIVNPDAGCQCSIATEPTSWGRVKALYR